MTPKSATEILSAFQSSLFGMADAELEGLTGGPDEDASPEELAAWTAHQHAFLDNFVIVGPEGRQEKFRHLEREMLALASELKALGRKSVPPEVQMRLSDLGSILKVGPVRTLEGRFELVLQDLPAASKEQMDSFIASLQAAIHLPPTSATLRVSNLALRTSALNPQTLTAVCDVFFQGQESHSPETALDLAQVRVSLPGGGAIAMTPRCVRPLPSATAL